MPSPTQILLWAVAAMGVANGVMARVLRGEKPDANQVRALQDIASTTNTTDATQQPITPSFNVSAVHAEHSNLQAAERNNAAVHKKVKPTTNVPGQELTPGHCAYIDTAKITKDLVLPLPGGTNIVILAKPTFIEGNDQPVRKFILLLPKEKLTAKNANWVDYVDKKHGGHALPVPDGAVMRINYDHTTDPYNHPFGVVSFDFPNLTPNWDGHHAKDYAGGFAYESVASIAIPDDPVNIPDNILSDHSGTGFGSGIQLCPREGFGAGYYAGGTGHGRLLTDIGQVQLGGNVATWQRADSGPRTTGKKA